MVPASIGVHLDDLRMPIRQAATRAAEWAFRCVELGMISGVSGALDPRVLGNSGRRHVLRFLNGLGLQLKALSADLPGVRLTDPGRVEERIDRTRETLEAARELRVPVVTTFVSALTHPQTGEASLCAVDALRQMGEDAERFGVVLALRPSADQPEHLARLLTEVNRPMIRLCIDPAALLMSGVSPTTLVAARPDDIVLSHARDGRRGSADRAGIETRLGEGDVDWNGHLALLEAAGYSGPQILRRLDATDPQADLLAGRRWLEQAMADLRR